MNFVIFSKNAADQKNPSVREWDLAQKDIIIRDVSGNGVLCLASESSFKLLADGFEKANYFRCGIKVDKVELFRSLDFHKKIQKAQPRMLIFKGSDRGALKRSASQFFLHRYSAKDPACLIVVSDDLFDLIVKDYRTIASRKRSPKNKFGDNAIGELLEETGNDPVISEISKVYIGSSDEMRLARVMILKASQTTSPVLILGESGTGKDVIAQQISTHAKFYNKSFAIVNCAALPETLLEGELFGYKKGSYTGATQDKDGLLVFHKGGTVFLDEVGDLTLANQAKLLLAIDSKIVRPIGGDENVKIDVRIIAATNRNVDYMAMNGSFREDLLYRLNVLRILAPPLRNHPDDIPDIADHLWEKLNPKYKLSKKFHQKLKTYPWPGNVRELKSLLTGITDLFNDKPPEPRHIEAIHDYMRKNLISMVNSPLDDNAKVLKLEAKIRLTNLQNIVRGVKVAMRPVINKEMTPDNYREESEKIRHHIAQQVDIIENLCREPVYFKDYGLFKETTRYRYLLDKMLKHWPHSADDLLNAWAKELQKLDEDITLGILKLMWGTNDM